MTFRTLVLAATAAVSVMSAVSAQGAVLVAHYTFSNAANLGADSSGFGNNATVSNVSQSAGPLPGESAGQFNAQADFRVSGGLNGYTGSPGFSFVTWVEVTLDSGYEGLITQDYTGCCTNRLLLQEGDQPYIDGGEHVDHAVTGTYPIGTWYQVALTGQDTTGGSVDDVYVDGALAGEFNFNFATRDLSGVNTYIGAGDNGGLYHLNGSLADTRIYQGALTGQEVLDLYNDVPNGPTTPGVPEPATWALMISGFGLAGASLRRRRELLA